MLILMRKGGQGIWIEGDIWVKVLSVERDRVRLGITAPGDVKVMRQELLHGGEENQPFADKAQGATNSKPTTEVSTRPPS